MSDKLPDREPDGQFDTFDRWVNHATSWIGGTNSLCADAQGRICRIGADMMRARDENAFPVRYWFGAGPIKSAKELRRTQSLARKAMKLKHP